MEKSFYMVGSAHLDPVWTWRWQEGAAEALATFRSALDRMNETDDFIFTCAAAAVYKWVEETAPEMFEEIKQRVKEGRWVITGGWWVQCDCNLPSMESFARQALIAQRYFYEKFQITARVGYSVDSFGHNAMLPQLLKKSGMGAYVYMRPGTHEKPQAHSTFLWESPDGTKIPAFRITERYNHNFSDQDELTRALKIAAEGTNTTDEVMLFYGVGNHGGGPTKQNLKIIKERQQKEPSLKMKFSSPNEYFDELDSEKLPTVKDDLQHHASGCYSAVSLIKALNRNSENALISAEKYSSMANILLGTPYPGNKFNEAWQNVLFNQFHDSLGGCSVKGVYDDVKNSAGEALFIADKAKNRALQSIAWNIDTTQGGVPIIVFNPNAHVVRQDIEVNAKFNSVKNCAEGCVPVQFVDAEGKYCHGRPSTLFTAVVPPMGYSVYYGLEEKVDFDSPVFACKDYIENELVRVSFDKKTGHISSIFSKKTGEHLSAPASPIVIDEYDHDCWSHQMNFFDKRIGVFEGSDITVLENGPVRASVRVKTAWGDSTLTQVFSLTSLSDIVEVTASVDWHEKHKMLKLSYPTCSKDPKAVYEIQGAAFVRPTDGEEEPAQKWASVMGAGGIALLNRDKHSYSIKDNEICLTALRSPIYADHGQPRDGEPTFTDQGEHTFSYSIMLMEENTELADISRAALERNERFTHIIGSVHSGRLPEQRSFIDIDTDSVIVTSFKRAYDNKGWVVRAYNMSETPTFAEIKMKDISLHIGLTFGKYEIKTLYIDDSNNVTEVMLTEW